MPSGSKLVLFAALGGNVAIAVTKFVAAAIAGSSSMLTEGIHSLVDSTNQVLMLYGRAQAQRPPDEVHPLGYGREIFFWGFVVALLIFTAGAGMSVYEGIVHIREPEMFERPLVNFAVLAIAFVFEAVSLSFAVREFLQTIEPGETWWQALRESKDPAVFVVLLEDSAALTGLVIAAVFMTLALITGNPLWDGLGSVFIGLLLGAVAAILARECKALLIGERARPRLQRDIREIAESHREVCVVNEVLTVQLAPEQVVAMISLDLDDDISLAQAEAVADAIERESKEAHPSVMRLFIRPQSREQARAEQKDLAENPPV